MTQAAAIEALNNAILDLQQADYNTYERPVKKMAMALNDPELIAINKKLRDNVDFEQFIENSQQGGTLIGSAQLQWPLQREDELGLTLQIIEKAGEDPKWLEEFAFHWFHDGNKIISGIRKLTRSVLIPFARDYKTFIAEIASKGLNESKTSAEIPIVDRIEQNKLPIIFLSDQVILLLEEFREKIRGDNKLKQAERDAAIKALERLHDLSSEARLMSAAPLENLIENEDVKSWPKRFRSACEENFRTTINPENLASATLPTGLILGCGSLGALVAGPTGFGVGSIFGHLISVK